MRSQSISAGSRKIAPEVTHARVEIRQSLEFLLDEFPIGHGIDQQATVRISRNDQVPAAPFEQCVAVPRRHREPAFAVQIELRDAPKHEPPLARGQRRFRNRKRAPFFPTFYHFYPLYFKV